MQVTVQVGDFLRTAYRHQYLLFILKHAYLHLLKHIETVWVEVFHIFILRNHATSKFYPIFNIISNMHNSIYGIRLMSYSPVIGGSNPRKGDILVIAGATLYAISNVSEVS